MIKITGKERDGGILTQERSHGDRDAGLEVLMAEEDRSVGDHQGRERRDECVHQLVDEVPSKPDEKKKVCRF